MDDQEKKSILDDFSNGMTITKIIEKYHRSFYTIQKILDEAGLDHSKSSMTKGIGRKIKKEDEKKICFQYINGKSMAELAKDFSVNTTYPIKQILIRNNVRIRTVAEASAISNRSYMYSKDESFFSNQSRDIAWLLGFIASDGTVRKDSNEIKIGLQKRDDEILFKIKEAVKIENPVTYYKTEKGYEVCSLKWACAQHKKDLEKYSITPQKTFTLEPPYGLEKKFWVDYIRGYFDGDGSINLIKNSNHRGNGNLRWQVCSATKNILEFIVDFFYEEYGVPKVSILEMSKNRKNTLYYIQYSSTATRMIYDFLYTDSKMFLKRKKDHYEEILNMVTPLDEIVSHETVLS